MCVYVYLDLRFPLLVPTSASTSTAKARTLSQSDICQPDNKSAVAVTAGVSHYTGALACFCSYFNLRVQRKDLSISSSVNSMKYSNYVLRWFTFVVYSSIFTDVISFFINYRYTTIKNQNWILVI